MTEKSTFEYLRPAVMEDRLAVLAARTDECLLAAQSHANRLETRLARRLLVVHREMFTNERSKLVLFQESMERAAATVSEADQEMMGQMRAAAMAAVMSQPVPTVRQEQADDIAELHEREAETRAKHAAAQQRGKDAAKAKRSRFAELEASGAEECWQCAICGQPNAAASLDSSALSDGGEDDDAATAAEEGEAIATSDAPSSSSSSSTSTCSCITCSALRGRTPAVLLSESRPLLSHADPRWREGEEASDWLTRTAVLQSQPFVRAWLGRRAFGRLVDARIEAGLKAMRFLVCVSQLQRRYRAHARTRKWRHTMLCIRVKLRWRKMVARGQLRRALIYTRVWRGHRGRVEGNALRKIRDDKRLNEINRSVMAVRLQRTMRRRWRRACAPLLSFWQLVVKRRKMMRVLNLFVDAHLERNFRLAEGTAAAITLQRWLRLIITERLRIERSARRVVRAMRGLKRRRLLGRIRNAAKVGLEKKHAAERSERLVWQKANPVLGVKGKYVDAWAEKTDEAMHEFYVRASQVGSDDEGDDDEEEEVKAESSPMAIPVRAPMQRRASSSSSASVATKVESPRASLASAADVSSSPSSRSSRVSLFEYSSGVSENERPLHIARTAPDPMRAPSPSAQYDRRRKLYNFHATSTHGADMVDPTTLTRPDVVADPLARTEDILRSAVEKGRGRGAAGASGRAVNSSMRFTSVLRVTKVRGKIHKRTVDVVSGPPTRWARLVSEDHSRKQSAREWKQHEWEWGNELRHGVRESLAGPPEAFDLLLGSAPPVPRKMARAGAALQRSPWHRAHEPIIRTSQKVFRQKPVRPQHVAVRPQGPLSPKARRRRAQ